MELNADLPSDSAGASVPRRRLAAASLQAATRDFAAAFLGSGRGQGAP